MTNQSSPREKLLWSITLMRVAARTVSDCAHRHHASPDACRRRLVRLAAQLEQGARRAAEIFAMPTIEHHDTFDRN